MPSTTDTPLPTPPTAPRLSSRLIGTRECEGDHVQPMLFRPVGDETFCPRCMPLAAGADSLPAPQTTRRDRLLGV